MAPSLASHVLLAFDDFSLAGRYVLEYADVEGSVKRVVDLNELSLPEELVKYMTLTHYMNERNNLQVSTISIASRSLDGTILWRLCDALVTFLSKNTIEILTIIASLHLPHAKSHTIPVENIYLGHLSEGALVHHKKIKPLDSGWEIKDAFLARFVHFLRVEQAFTTHLLVVKGYKAAQESTKDSIQALAKSLEILYGDDLCLKTDLQHAVRSAQEQLHLTKHRMTPTDTLLYQ